MGFRVRPVRRESTLNTMSVCLVPIDDKGGSSPLSVFWEVEPGTEIRPRSELPDPGEGVDDAETFAGFLDAVRWGAVASVDPRAFQSPFRAGIDIEDYQLLPLVRALRMPRVGLLIADDVGLGKTVEAGLIAQELVLRNQARKILVVCPPSLCAKWQREMREQFGLGFEIINAERVRRLRRERGVGVNPFRSHPRLIVSMEWVKFESQMRWFDEFLPPDPNTYPRAFDLHLSEGVRSAHRGRGPSHRPVRGGPLRPGFATHEGDATAGRPVLQPTSRKYNHYSSARLRRQTRFRGACRPARRQGKRAGHHRCHGGRI